MYCSHNLVKIPNPGNGRYSDHLSVYRPQWQPWLHLLLLLHLFLLPWTPSPAPQVSLARAVTLLVHGQEGLAMAEKTTMVLYRC